MVKILKMIVKGVRGTVAYWQTQISNHIYINAHLFMFWQKKLWKFTKILYNLHNPDQQDDLINYPSQIMFTQKKS